MSKYFPLHCHSHFSLLDGLSQPHQIAKRIHKLGLPGCALTDHGNIAGSIQVVKALHDACANCGDQKGDHPTTHCKEHVQSTFKPIIGCELYLSNKSSLIKSKDNRKLFHQVVLAKNMDGWKSLIKMTSDSNSPDRMYHRPRLDFKYFEDNGSNGIITFSGHLGSHLSNVAQQEGKEAAIRAAEYLRDLFGKDNFFIEIQNIDQIINKEAKIVSDILREVSQITKIPKIATADSHYCAMEDACDQQVLLCNQLKTTINRVNNSIANDDEEVGLGCFFKSNKFHIPSHEEMAAIHTGDEIDNTLLIASQVEDYNVLGKPILPPFKTPDGSSPDDYLRHLCREGWRRKIKDRVDPSKHHIYAERVKRELGVLQGADLSSYFLIVQDIVQYAKGNGWLTGPGRGSAAGCLVSYLINITAIDPIPYNLLFERFYNAGRNTAERVSYPDIDVDVPVNKRARIIQYIRDTYGHDKVSQMATFQTLKGRGAIKAVFRAHGGLDQEEINEITKHIPDPAKIAGDLQEMKEETDESSIVRWALENRAKDLKKWCYIDKDGNLQGPLSKRFEQAIRLEGTKVSLGRHPSGIVVAPKALSEICPMILDKEEKEMVAGMEMGDLESLGLIKLDVLGLRFLDKIVGVQQILRTGDLYD